MNVLLVIGAIVAGVAAFARIVTWRPRNVGELGLRGNNRVIRLRRRQLSSRGRPPKHALKSMRRYPYTLPPALPSRRRRAVRRRLFRGIARS